MIINKLLKMENITGIKRKREIDQDDINQYFTDNNQREAFNKAVEDMLKLKEKKRMDEIKLKKKKVWKKVFKKIRCNSVFIGMFNEVRDKRLKIKNELEAKIKLYDEKIKELKKSRDNLNEYNNNRKARMCNLFGNIYNAHNRSQYSFERYNDNYTSLLKTANENEKEHNDKLTEINNNIIRIKRYRITISNELKKFN